MEQTFSIIIRSNDKTNDTDTTGKCTIRLKCPTQYKYIQCIGTSFFIQFDIRTEYSSTCCELQAEGIDIDLINMASIKPIDEQLIIESAKKTGLVFTVEDHNIIGGLGSAVCEVLSEKQPTRVVRIGVKDKFGASGSPADLYAAYGLDEAGILKVIRENLK